MESSSCLGYLYDFASLMKSFSSECPAEDTVSNFYMTEVTHHQKLRLLKHEVCPRLTWPLPSVAFPTFWLQEVGKTGSTLQSISFTLSKPSDYFSLSREVGGLAMPSLVKKAAGNEDGTAGHVQ